MTNGNREDWAGGAWHLIKRLALLVAGIYALFRYGPALLRHLESIVVSVLAAVVLAYALMPGVDWLCRGPFRKCARRPRRVAAAVIVLLAFLALSGLSVWLFIDPLQKEIAHFSGKVGDYSKEISHFFGRLTDWYNRTVPERIRSLILKQDYSRAAEWATRSVQRVVTFATSSVFFLLEIVLVPVLAFYFILDHKSISREFYGLIPEPRRKNAVILGRRIGEIMQRYIFGQIILCAIAAILTGLFLSLMNMPYVVVLALFSGVTRAIPIIGPVVSGVPIVLVGLLYSGGHWGLPLYLLVFIVVMHFAESKFIMPHLIGDRLHLNPAIVIIVLLIGAEFMGIVGMFLAAPAAAVIREFIRFYYIRPASPARKAAGGGQA